MNATIEIDAMFSACESLFNYISVMDDMEEIAMESEGTNSGNSIPWYKKVLDSIKKLIMKIKTKYNEFFIKKLEKNPNNVLTIPDKVVDFIKKVLTTVNKQKALLNNIDFVNYSNNSSMVIAKVSKAVTQIEELASTFCKGGELKKARLEEISKINSGHKVLNASNILINIRKDISDSVSDFENSIETILSNAEKYNSESKQAATEACSICTNLLKIVDTYVRYALSASCILVRRSN